MLMKKVTSVLAIAVSAMLFSCSKDEPTTPEKSEEAVMKVELTYTGNIDKFDETLTLQVVSKQSSATKIVEADLEKTNPTADVVWFTKPLSTVSAKSTYTTSTKISTMTVAGVITPKQINDTSAEVVNATIKVYSNDKLVETKTVTAKADKAYTFSYPVTAQ